MDGGHTPNTRDRHPQSPLLSRAKYQHGVSPVSRTELDIEHGVHSSAIFRKWSETISISPSSEECT